MGVRRSMVKLFMLLTFGGWILLWVMRPSMSFESMWKHFLHLTRTKAYGPIGGFNLAFSVPIVILVVLGAFYFQLRRGGGRHKGHRHGSVSSWTYPVLVDGPLSIVSAAEFAILLLFLAVLLWTLVGALVAGFHFQSINAAKLQNMDMPLWQKKFEVVGIETGFAGTICCAFLFFPVARGSLFLKLVNVPFEHAVKYHMWLAHLMGLLWTAHGIVYLVYWPLAGKFRHKITSSTTQLNVIGALTAWSVGLVIWITALPSVRKLRFEVFYYTHQLYPLYILALAVHAGDKSYYAILGGFLLFLVNRFVRLMQSRRRVDVLAAQMMTSETMELVIAKHPSLEYNPASFILVNIPAVSALQWHPFTVMSSSNVDTDHLSLLIKCHGEWTSKLKQQLVNYDGKHFFQLEAAVEGPYGHNLDYLFVYDALIFAAGGSGISPFISILKDTLYRIQHKEIVPPREILLIWVVRKSEELSILDLVSPAAICPDFSSRFALNIQVYVTQDDQLDYDWSFKTANEEMTSLLAVTNGPTRGIHANDGIHNNSLYALVVLASFVGFALILGLIGRYYIYPADGFSYAVVRKGIRGLVAFIATVAGVIFFGGPVILGWRLLKARPKQVQVAVPSKFLSGSAMFNAIQSGIVDPSKNSKVYHELSKFYNLATVMENEELNESKMRQCSVPLSKGLEATKIHFRKRPDFHDIFLDHMRRAVGFQVGVFACGPVQMQEALAEECSAHRYHYHPLNYTL